MPSIEIDDLKQLLVQNCMLKIKLDEIKADTPLFGPGSVGLDSIDALQMALAIEKTYRVPLKDPQTAREALSSLKTLQSWLAQNESQPKV
jgi:acyl carrier protein